MCVGIVSISLGYDTILDAKHYTHSSTRGFATVTDIYHKTYKTVKTSVTVYSYTITFTHEDISYDVDMVAPGSRKADVDMGELIEIYYYPETLAEGETPIVACVQLHEEQGKDYIAFGVFNCFVCIALLLYTTSRKKLLKRGFKTMAKVTILGPNTSNITLSNKGETELICLGKNPINGNNQFFRTVGKDYHFTYRCIGENVAVYVDGNNSQRYLIDT